jgi:hypothetical protein
MSAPDEGGPVLYAERGSSWWPVLWGPAFAAVGAAVESLTGPVHTAAWLIVGIGLAGVAAVWVNARRKLLLVRLTPTALTQGREHLPVPRIAEVDEVGHPTGARVLGGGWTAPRKYTELPVRLDDGTVVIAWAKDVAALQTALRRLLNPAR